MNLNDFVVLPNNKAKSVKLNARNLQELQMETVTLAQESKEMEEKLQQLKESMSKEKEERGHSGGFRWKSGQCGNALTNSTKRNKENRLQKLSAGKVKIRVLRDEPLTAPPQPPPAPQPPTIGLRTTRRNRLRGTLCGQCEVKTAGLICSECTENYCIGCFAKFHQKGALKFHRMIPIQRDLQTHVSARDVVSYYPSALTSPNASPNSKSNASHTSTSNASSRKGDQSPEKETEAVAKAMQLHHGTSQVLVVSHGEEKKMEMVEKGLKREDERGFPTSLLRGEYNEEESARSFQEALRQWRAETSDGAGEPMSEDAMWIPVRPVSVSAMATQADLPPDRGAEGRGSGGGHERVPVRVEFTENSLTYMDRLLLKKHRRTPVEMYNPSLAFGPDLPSTHTDEEDSLTAQEEDFRCYCASLFAVPVSSSRSEAQITTPEPCLLIEVLDETDRDINGVFLLEQKTDNNRKVPSFQEVSSNRITSVPQTASTSGESSRVRYSSTSPTQPSRQSRAPTQPKTAQKLHTSKLQTSQAEHSVKSVPSKGMPSACPTAVTPRTSIKTPTSKSQKPNCSPHCQQAEILKVCNSPLSCPPDVSPLASTRSPISEEPLSHSPSMSFSLRSTFTASPSSSTESTLLPKIYHSTPLQKGSDSSVLPQQPQSSKLFPDPVSSPKLSQSPPSNLESPKQSQHSLCDPECLPLDNQLQLPLSSRPTPQSKSLEPRLPQTNPVPFQAPVKTLSPLSLSNESLSDAYSRCKSAPTNGDALVFMSSTSISGDHESALSHQDTERIPSLSSHPLNVIQNSPLSIKIEEEEELSIDGGDEMSSDSLGLAPHEDNSSDEEAQMCGRLKGGRSREEEQGNSAISHQGDSFLPTDAKREKDLQTDEQEQLSEPSTVMHNQSAGSGSEQFCDLDGFSPLGLDLNSGHSDTPEDTHCDPLCACQTSLHDSDPTEPHGRSSSLSTSTEKHQIFKMMKDNHTQPTGIQIYSTTPSRKEDVSAVELGTSESGPAFRPLSRAAQEIMEICSVDQTGCEDPDLDTDTTAHTLHGLERELRRMANETGTQASVFGMGNSGSQNQHGNHYWTRDRVSEEQKEEEEAAQSDRLSVLLLP